MDAARGFEHGVVADTVKVAGLAFAESREQLEDALGAGPFAEHVGHAPRLGDAPEDFEIGPRFAGRRGDLPDDADAPLGVDECAFLFAPAGRGQHEIGEACGFRGRVHVLHDQKLEPREDGFDIGLIDPRVRRIGGDDPETANLAGGDGGDRPPGGRDTLDLARFFSVL